MQEFEIPKDVLSKQNDMNNSESILSKGQKCISMSEESIKYYESF